MTAEATRATVHPAGSKSGRLKRIKLITRSGSSPRVQPPSVSTLPSAPRRTARRQHSNCSRLQKSKQSRPHPSVLSSSRNEMARLITIPRRAKNTRGPAAPPGARGGGEGGGPGRSPFGRDDCVVAAHPAALHLPRGAAASGLTGTSRAVGAARARTDARGKVPFSSTSRPPRKSRTRDRRSRARARACAPAALARGIRRS